MTYGTNERIRDEKAENFVLRPGFQFGVVGRVARLSQSTSIGAELIYEARRSTIQVDYTHGKWADASLSLKGQLDDYYGYLSLPVLLKREVGKKQVYIGPSFSYLLHAKRTTDLFLSQGLISGATNASVDERINLISNEGFTDSAINRLNVAINAGVTMPLTSRLDLDLRLLHTLTDVTNDDADVGLFRDLIDEQYYQFRKDFDSTVSLQANLAFRF